jgi:hypothetical protein
MPGKAHLFRETSHGRWSGLDRSYHHWRDCRVAGRAIHVVIVAAAEAANQVSYAEGNGGARVWTLLYGGAEEVLSPGGLFANSFHGIRCRLLHLSVDILRCPFHLFCLALKLTFYVARARPNPSSTRPPTFLALPITRSSFMSVILLRFRDFNGWNGSRVLFPRANQTDNINGL